MVRLVYLTFISYIIYVKGCKFSMLRLLFHRTNLFRYSVVREMYKPIPKGLILHPKGLMAC